MNLRTKSQRNTEATHNRDRKKGENNANERVIVQSVSHAMEERYMKLVEYAKKNGYPDL